VSVYAHAKKNFTKKGQKVHKGQVIAQVGMTGRTTGPHLHFETRIGKRVVNPMIYLSTSRDQILAQSR
jgi:murein DD-endopeptidase MepM/ murein hydrolase activator NlpD